MAKNLSQREKNRRMFLDMYTSLENKMSGENLLWWMSLSLRARYSVLFKWMMFKRSNRKV